ncbi:RNA-directed DNA polymerase from mobile element jockey [Willisornis vidua]|uniref:RNA-directed DNA polymerase from mobile element jockey n=1 Tax=Willisornis vidua TaxID=1566151 RepID=A0ABQ9DC74_9PASS|nr:RNA-directed DNA polymerase from mobile element jockey [Willisornis vidua]
MDVRRINSQLTLKLCGIWCSSWSIIWPGGIHLRILKELADVIVRPPSMIFEWCLESGEVPVDRQLASIVTFFEKDKKEEPGNNRPINLTPEPGKIMKIILGSIEKHLKGDTIIGHSQHGHDKNVLLVKSDFIL